MIDIISNRKFSRKQINSHAHPPHAHPPPTLIFGLHVFPMDIFLFKVNLLCHFITIKI